MYTITQAVQDYEIAVLNLSKHTQRWYTQKLRDFADWCGRDEVTLEGLTPTHVRRYLDYLRTRTNPRTGRPVSSYTLHGYAQVVRGFLNWAVKEELYGVREKQPQRIELPRVEGRVIEVFTRGQLQRLLKVCANEASRELQVRDEAILRTLLSTGIRVSELVGLTLEHTHLEQHDAHLRVLGKGRKEREVPMGVEARKSLYRYVSRYRHAEARERHVFLNRSGKAMTFDGVDQMLYRLRDWAGAHHFEGIRVSAHTFRHTFATEFLRQSENIYRLSRLLGHASVGVTEVYLRAVKARDARQGVDVFGDL